MTNRYLSVPFYIPAALLGSLTVGTIYVNWPESPEMSLSLTWTSLFLLALPSQVCVVYLVWRSRRRRGSVIHTDVLNSLVHEFQTPITAIRMSADVLDSPIARNQPERTEKYVRIIREETERLQHQVETMLTLARADRNTLVLNQEPIRLHSLLRAIAERHGDYLRLDLPGPDVHLLADRLHLTNVLHNLLDNAVKYSAGQPDITLYAELDTDGLLISVRDRGVGIPKKHLSRIFQPFYRVHDHQQPSVKGFGLGLSYVHRIIVAHNWRINVKSEIGEGSEFRIRIPLASILSLDHTRQPAEVATRWLSQVAIG